MNQYVLKNMEIITMLKIKAPNSPLQNDSLLAALYLYLFLFGLFLLADVSLSLICSFLRANTY